MTDRTTTLDRVEAPAAAAFASRIAGLVDIVQACGGARLPTAPIRRIGDRA